MNARVKLITDESGLPLSSDGIWTSVQQILSSPGFAKAPRMCKLLSFLIEKKLSGQEQQLTEYAIGLEVFRRDARLYDTTLDPVVRVQIGRLRGRLGDYYKALGNTSKVQVTIPLGSYIPMVAQAAPPSFRCDQLLVAPLRNLACEQGSNAFVCGLDEELGSRLFHAFGRAIQLHEAGPTIPASGFIKPSLPHRLEGSIRVEDNHVRASMRLVDAGAGKIAWLSQFDCRGQLGISLQEQLASAICEGLQRYLVDF